MGYIMAHIKGPWPIKPHNTTDILLFPCPWPVLFCSPNEAIPTHRAPLSRATRLLRPRRRRPPPRSQDRKLRVLRN